MFALDRRERGVAIGPARPMAFGNAGVSRLARILDAEQSRWFYWLPVFLGFGVGLYFALPFEPGISVLPPLLITFAGLLRFLPRSLFSVLLLGMFFMVSLGFVSAKLRTEWVRAPKIMKTVGPLVVEGWVERMEPRPKNGHRVTLAVTKAGELDAANLPVRVRLYFKSDKPDINIGDYIQTSAILRPPPSPAQPGGYDFARAQWYKKLGAVGYAVKELKRVDPRQPPSWSLRAWGELERLRASVGQRVNAHLEGQAGAVAVALLTGERSGIAAQTQTDLRHSGLAHILAISGLHMAVMSGTVFWLIRAFLALSARLTLTMPIKKWSALIAILGALFYLALSGASTATQRAFLMVVLFYLAILVDRPALSLRNVAIAALVILVFWPESLLNIGFQMSFAAVTALIAFYEMWNGRVLSSVDNTWRYSLPGRLFHFFAGIALTTIVAGLAIAPLSAFHFGREAGYSLLANLLALPVFSFITMPMALLTLLTMPFGLEALPLQLMGKGIEIILWVAAWVSNLPGAVLYIAHVPQYALVVLMLGALWLMLWHHSWRYLGLIGIAAGLWLFQTGPRPDILVSDNARTVAVRNMDLSDAILRLGAPRGSSRSYVLARWLEKDGDARAASAAAKGENYKCDKQGCVTKIKNLTLAFTRSAAGLMDDCNRADILIARFAVIQPCAKPRLLIDKSMTARMGTHAIYIDGGKFRVKTVEALRGRRPWSRRPAP